MACFLTVHVFPPFCTLPATSLPAFNLLLVYSAISTNPRLALANEKRRKRRESHNAVERRRRDNINEKIQELAMLLPDEWLSDGAKTASMAGMLSGTVSGSIGGEEDTKEVKANKGVILRNSVEYIKCVSLSAIHFVFWVGSNILRALSVT